MNTSNIQIIQLQYLAEDGMEYVDGPSLAEVMDVLNAMDGKEKDVLSIKLNSGDSMDVGGGANGRYKCHVRTKKSFYDLLDPLVPMDMSDTLDIQFGNEINSFPRCTIVSLDMAKSAMEYFCEAGELSSSLAWSNTLIYEPL